MIGSIFAFVLDCPDPERLASFYQNLLGGRVEPDPDDEGWLDLIFSDEGPRLSFQLSPGFRAPRWPSDDGDQQGHVDIQVADIDEAHLRIIELGAQFVQDRGSFRVYLDLAGHPFCTFI